jgi:hypothetical protein
MSAKHEPALTPPRQYDAENLILEITEWHTPATDYPLTRFGSARLVRTPYKRGFYRMEGIDGYNIYELKRPVDVTTIQIDNRVVMVDDPCHWIGMQRLAYLAEGRTLVIGLGLGLVIHALVRNDKVTKIDVVDINPDVIDLMKDNLPNDSRLEVHCGDGISWEGEYDTVIVDILVKSEEETKVAVAGSKRPLNGTTIWDILAIKFPDAKVMQWGYRDERWNPAYTWEGDWHGP